MYVGFCHQEVQAAVLSKELKINLIGKNIALERDMAKERTEREIQKVKIYQDRYEILQRRDASYVTEEFQMRLHRKENKEKTKKTCQF